MPQSSLLSISSALMGITAWKKHPKSTPQSIFPRPWCTPAAVNRKLFKQTAWECLMVVRTSALSGIREEILASNNRANASAKDEEFWVVCLSDGKADGLCMMWMCMRFFYLLCCSAVGREEREMGEEVALQVTQSPRQEKKAWASKSFARKMLMLRSCY